MLKSGELDPTIARQAEQRKQELMEAFGGNFLLSNGRTSKSGNQVTPQKSQYRKPFGKENKFPSTEADRLYPSKPPRSVYNSPLIKSQRESLWKSTSSSPTEKKEAQLKWSSSSLTPYVSPFKTATLDSSSVSSIRQSHVAKLSTTARLYPSLPPLETSDKILENNVEEKELKDYSNRSTANASRRPNTSLKLLSENKSDPIVKPLASSTVADLRMCQEDNSSGITSVVLNDKVSVQKGGYRDQSEASSDDIEDTYDMDKFLEEALGSQLDLCSSRDCDVPPESQLHTLSRYRSLNKRPSSSTLKSSLQHHDLMTSSDELHGSSVERLMKEADKQQQLMVQASKALYICRSAKAFSTSMSLVEGERLLLLSTLRHQAALGEIKNVTSSVFIPADTRGSVKIMNICANLKLNSIHSSKNHSHISQWFTCLLSFGEQVVASEVVPYEEGSESLKFSSTLELTNLPKTFKATFQIYSLRVYDSKESTSKSKMSRACKLLRRQSKSCLGPAASEQLLFLRTPAFSLAGSTCVSLNNVHNLQPILVTLDKVPLMSPLNGSVWLQVVATSNLSLDMNGFLNILEQVGHCHTWQRRWCYFNGISLCFWNYPTDQDEKEPVTIINLHDSVSDSVCVAPRHLCARARTLMLETSHLPKPQDLDSTLITCKPLETIHRHFLSCDTIADMNEWSSALNQALHALKTWRTSSQATVH